MPSPTPTPAPSLASLTLERKCEWYDVDGTFSDDLDVSPESDPEPEVDLKRDPESEHEPERTPGYQRPERKDSQPKPSSKAVRKSSVSFTHNADNITIELPPALARLITDGFRLSSSTPRYLKAVVNGVVHRPSGRVGVGVWWSDEGRAAGKNVSERIHEGSGSDGEADSHEEGSAGSVSEGVANIIAIIRAIEACPHPELPLELDVGDTYAWTIVTDTIHKWQSKWFSDLESHPDRLVIGHLIALLREREHPVRFKFIRGHHGSNASFELARKAALNAHRQPHRIKYKSPDAYAREAPRKAKHVSITRSIMI